MRIETDSVGGVTFVRSDVERISSWLTGNLACSGAGINLRLANAYNVALASKSRFYASVMSDPRGVNLPDGTPIAWALRLRRRRPEARQVRGPSLFRATLNSTRDGVLSHFFLGSTDKVLQSLSQNIMTQYEGVRIAGAYSPPYAEIDDDYVELCARVVRDATPDILWLGLGTPKQDVLGTRLAYELDIPIVNVGAAFDFVAGSVNEAPAWLQGTGFEWIFRFAKEPRRLWKRYILGNIRFVLVTLVRWRG